MAAAVLDDLVHGQEVALVLQLPDQIQFLHQLRDLAPELPSQAALGPLEGPPAQVLAGVHSFRQTLQRIAVTQLLEREGTAVGHLTGPLDRLGIIGKKTSQIVRTPSGRADRWAG